jgi:hypothetical protein
MGAGLGWNGTSDLCMGCMGLELLLWEPLRWVVIVAASAHARYPLPRIRYLQRKQSLVKEGLQGWRTELGGSFGRWQTWRALVLPPGHWIWFPNQVYVWGESPAKVGFLKP